MGGLGGFDDGVFGRDCEALLLSSMVGDERLVDRRTKFVVVKKGMTPSLDGFVSNGVADMHAIARTRG